MPDRMTAQQLRETHGSKPRRHVDREGPVHRAVLAYLRRALPGAVIHHSPNETDMRGPTVARMISKQKCLGMVVGFPDLIIFWRGHVWAMEVKAEKGRVSPDQEAVGGAMVANGVRWAVVRSVDDARACVAAWFDKNEGRGD